VGEIELAVVVPVYCEQESLELFWHELSRILNEMAIVHEVIFVNDGSTDSSSDILKTFKGHNVKIVNLLVNSGHMAALDAGYRATTANWIVTLDSDLQHPPSEIPNLLNLAKESNVDIVYAVRHSRTEDGWTKRLSAGLYYKLIRKVSGVEVVSHAADFRLISKRVNQVIRQIPPGSHVFRILFPMYKFSYATYPYSAAERALGKSKYDFRRMLSLAILSVISTSLRPLTLSIYLGLIFSGLSVLGLMYSIFTYFNGDTSAGWASIVSTLFLMFGILFLVLGIISAYLAMIWRKTSGIPEYFISNTDPD
jgi:glycosyltransferase involved in cell wall biosynthesis